MPFKCECEHIAHVDRKEKTPNGNPGHRYGVTFLALVTVLTPFGKFKVCKDCARDCYQDYPRAE